MTNIPKTVLAILVASLTVLLIGLASSGARAEELINTDPDGVAIDGYDTVAYFTEHRAVRGRPGFSSSWQGVRWQFASGRHRDLFAADPVRYLPQFGGFCAAAMTRGVVVRADPEAWTIVEGRLYLKVNKVSTDRWRENSGVNIRKAQEHWATLDK